MNCLTVLLVEIEDVEEALVDVQELLSSKRFSVSSGISCCGTEVVIGLLILLFVAVIELGIPLFELI